MRPSSFCQGIRPSTRYRNNSRRVLRFLPWYSRSEKVGCSIELPSQCRPLPGSPYFAIIGLTCSEDSKARADRLRDDFAKWCRGNGHDNAAETLERDWERMTAYYDFPKEHWGHLKTTNPVESPFAALRLRTDAAKRYKRVDRAMAVIWKMLMVAEQRFRRVKCPDLMTDVYLGTQYVDGIAVQDMTEKVAA